MTRNSVLLLILFFTWWGSGTDCEGAPSAASVGMLDVPTVERVDSAGKEDSTSGLNRAIEQARDMRPSKTLFFLPGADLVSGTLT